MDLLFIKQDSDFQPVCRAARDRQVCRGEFSKIT